MPAKHARHIALSGPLVDWAERQAAHGEYSSLSELIRIAVRQLRDRDVAQRNASRAKQGDEPHA